MPIDNWLIAALIIWAVWGYFRFTKRRRTRMLAKDIVDQVKKGFAPVHQYRDVDPNDFSHLDLSYYVQARTLLEQHGFTFLADQENITLRNTFSDIKTFIRFMLGGNGTTIACLYHPKPNFLIKLVMKLTRARIGRTADFDTEFSDGAFVCTSNAEMAGALNTPPQIHVELLPAETPITDVLELHNRRVQQYCQENNVEPLTFDSIDEVHDSQNRQETLKAEFRKSIGWVTRDELENCYKKDPKASGKYRRHLDEIHEEIENINRNDEYPDINKK
jgi:hypothetical protein